MDPLTAAALIQTGYYGVQSLIDKKKGEEYANTPRPKYEIPAAATMMRNMGVSGMGQYGYAGMGQDIARSEQAMANALGTRGMSGLSGSQKMNLLAALTKGTQQQLGEIGATSERAKRGREQMGYNVLQAYAPYEEKQWEWDKKGPYLNAMETASRFEANSKAGMQAAVGMFSNLVAGGGLGGGKPKTSTPDLSPVQPMVPKGIDQTLPYQIDQPQLQLPPGYMEKMPSSPAFVYPQPERPAFDMNVSQQPMPYKQINYPTPFFDLPTPITRSFAENTLGMPIGDEAYNYYDMGNTYNKIFNNMYRNTWEPNNY